MTLLSKFQEDQDREAKRLLMRLIQESQYVGDVYSIGYEAASVQIHDYYRQQVGGIPSLCFLVATRIVPSANVVDYQKEDSSVILLRVMDSTPLPSHAEAERIRVEVAQKVAGKPEVNWDSTDHMDATTHHLLSFAGVKCRVIGTFFVDVSERLDRLALRFGSDLSNYYPNRGLKVYKPNKEALTSIVNYLDVDRIDETQSAQRVQIGDVRYASTNRSFQGISNVPVYISPVDLLGQKSALFGMTRTGKSNTTKIILQSVFNLRFADDKPQRIGQLVFDPNGEYANENAQDANRKLVPSAIKNVWRSYPDGKQEDVITYGVLKHPNDPNRRLMLLNFLDEQNLAIGKDIIDDALADDLNTKFIQAFRQVRFVPPNDDDRKSTNREVQQEYYRAKARYDRHVLAYRALLVRAGFHPSANLQPRLNGLFRDDLIRTMMQEPDEEVTETTPATQSRGHRSRPRESKNAANYRVAAQLLSRTNPTWAQVAQALEYLDEFIEDKDSGYQRFNEEYMNRPDGSGDPWADETFKKILIMYRYPNGVRQIGKVADRHTNATTSDYAEDIYKELVKGRLVIVDQSSGDEALNKVSAERIMRYLFQKQQDLFRAGVVYIPDILVYVEEAHTLLPAGNDIDLNDIWVRTAKEGAKYHIGLVYATQEVSSIQRNILRNTANWFIGHLNNTDETKELCKYYDFADFEASIRRAQDRGFLRVKTLSNLFVVPVQVKQFEV